MTGKACIIRTENIDSGSKLLQRLLIIIVISCRGLTSHSRCEGDFGVGYSQESKFRVCVVDFHCVSGTNGGPNDRCPKGIVRRPNSLARPNKFSDDCILRCIVSAGCWKLEIVISQPLITGRATAGIKITRVSNFAVFRPTGATRLD